MQPFDVPPCHSPGERVPVNKPSDQILTVASKRRGREADDLCLRKTDVAPIRPCWVSWAWAILSLASIHLLLLRLPK